MKKVLGPMVVLAASLVTVLWSGAGGAEAAGPRKVQRFGAVIGLKPEMKDEYVRLHANTWPEVLDALKKSNIQNYSIYLAQLDGKLSLFSYFEYTGSDMAKDQQRLKDNPKIREWWTHTDPCQNRLPDTKPGEQWKGIPEVFHMP
jgi:L-rhamnose mutarotase